MKRKKTKAETSVLWDFSMNHDKCAACWIPWSAAFIWRSGRLQIHHLINGSGRFNETCNLLLLCPECHNCMHSGPQIYGRYRAAGLTKLHCLQIKRDEYSEEWSEGRLCELWGRVALPELPGLPESFLHERTRWEGVTNADSFASMRW